MRGYKSAHSCRICRRWLEGEWSSATPKQRVELQRQMDAGHCDLCHARVCLQPCGLPIPGEREPCALQYGHDSEWCWSANIIEWQRSLGGPLPTRDLIPADDLHR